MTGGAVRWTCGLLVAAVLTAPAVVLGLPVLAVITVAASAPDTGCGDGPGARVDPTRDLPVAVAGYRGDQLRNAAAIMSAGVDLGLDRRAQTIAVMTAMAESSLRVLDHGDAVGPDSRGLFQQRDNGAWGSLADRMDPHRSATAFYLALQRVPGWQSLPPWIAAHRVQRNADPYVYQPRWPDAGQVVAALAGANTLGSSTLGGAHLLVDVTGQCVRNPGIAGASTAGWQSPVAGRISSAYGMRLHPTLGVYRLHTGTDIASPCGTPIRAAAAGVAVAAGPAAGYGQLIAIDHGGGTVTRYAHMYADGVLVEIGQPITGGQVIGRVGSNGRSTGCHLHTEVLQDQDLVDPQAFYGARGVTLGT
ncbi:MAG: peptidoglycan DD-metalloendopeptidase family protein [Kineosporiaceae bacterium]